MQTSSVFAPVVLEVTDTAFGVPRGTPTDDRYSHRYRLGPVHEEKTGSETLCEGGGDVERGVSIIPAPSFSLRVFNASILYLQPSPHFVNVQGADKTEPRAAST